MRGPIALPDMLVSLVEDGVTSFPHLRPHQRHAWHAFLVQLAALALVRADCSKPPRTAVGWTGLLRSLTPEWPGDEPWTLIAPSQSPALLQSAVLGGDLSDFKMVDTPDALDVLVTAKNHDVKAARMRAAEPEDWLFALLTLQTMEGFLGAGNYGISRMNGGYANRPALGIVPPGGPGARFNRDLRVILKHRAQILKRNLQYPQKGGIALVWLLPWDDETQIQFRDLDPFYIEICRRVRLVENQGRLTALTSGSRKSRIAAAEAKGVTGDPWIPVDVDGEPKSFSVGADGFNYRKMSELMFGDRFEKALLQIPDAIDPDDGLAVVACGLARGQGKTEGYHERWVPLSKTVKRAFQSGHAAKIAKIAAKRAHDAATMRGQVLRRALFVLLQDGPVVVKADDKSTNRQAEVWLRAYERAVDGIFFPRLWEAIDSGLECHASQHRWRRDLRNIARDVLERASKSVPLASMRQYRAWTRSQGCFFSLLYRNFEDLRPRETEHDAV